MATVDDIRLALAANLRQLPDVQIFPYPRIDVTTPALSVAGIREVDYLSDMGPGATMLFEIEGFTGSTSLDAAVKRFDRWVYPEGDDSVRAALEADQKLTSRLKADRVNVLADQASAAAAVQLRTFEGYRREHLGTGAEALVGIFVAEVMLT